MDDRGLLTPEDGQRYIDFCYRWGETPQGEPLETCGGCQRLIPLDHHAPGCHQPWGGLGKILWGKLLDILR